MPSPTPKIHHYGTFTTFGWPIAVDDFFLQAHAPCHAWSSTMTTLIFLQVSNSHPTLSSSNRVVIEYHLLSNHYNLSQSQETQVSAEHCGAFSIALKHEGTPHKNELTAYNITVMWLGLVVIDWKNCPDMFCMNTEFWLVVIGCNWNWACDDNVI